jgi:hypothetical protein
MLGDDVDHTLRRLDSATHKKSRSIDRLMAKSFKAAL